MKTPTIFAIGLAALANASALPAAEIHQAARAGDLAKVQALVTGDAGIVAATDDQGRTPLWHAAQRNRIEVARFLLEHKADPNARDSSGSPVLLMAAGVGRKEIVDLLLQNGAAIGAGDEIQETALHLAANNGRVEVVRLLLERGADVGAATKYGLTPLHYASFQDKSEIIELLLARGANPSVAADGGTTALHLTAGAGRTAAVVALVKSGAKADAVNADGETALHLAARGGYMEMVAALLPAAKNLDATEKHYGQTALHWAAIRGHATVVGLLRKAGANAGVKDASGRTALDCATRYGHADVVALLGGTPAAPTAAANTELAKPEAAGSAVVWYFGHSGWAVKTGRRLLVFDYWKGSQTPPAAPGLQNGFINPSELGDLEVTVFASHEHGDHFDPAVFAWKDAGLKVNYVYGFKPTETAKQKYAGPAYTFVGPQEQVEIAGMKVAGIKSLDTGGGFLVQVDGLVIFHAGDHANLNAGTREAYDKEITWLATLTDHVDLAFLPVSGCPSFWQRDQVIAGFFGAVSALKVKAAFPMHGFEREWDYREFAEIGKTRAPGTQVLCAEFSGDAFRYGGGKATVPGLR
jgi:ankyrin repeat protein/L-ascorbate metabolism protein UlaG (beta-lactamase superfamily)